MTDKNERILIVDDSPSDIQLLLENLKGEYAVTVATSGEKALEVAAKSPHPDVIVLDVVMPGMNGHDTCRKLKEDNATREIDVIFVSALNTVEEKLAGYAAGAVDYLFKPVQPLELMQKVKIAIENRRLRHTIMAEKNDAMTAAITAMTNIGELGIVLEFFRQSITIKNVDDLARRVIESVANYGLENTVRIVSENKSYHASTREPVPPIEKELLEQLRNRGRILSFGPRMVVTYGNVSTLIKNMPEDPDKQGRLRDHIALIVEAANARLGAIEAMSRDLLRTQHIIELVHAAQQALEKISSQQREHEEASIKIMNRTMQTLEASFLSFGLTDDQEQRLQEIVQKGIDDSLQHMEQGRQVDQQLRSLVEKLRRIA